MVFNFRTIDLTEDPVDFGEFASSTSSSSTSSDFTCTCTKTIVSRVVAPASHLFTVLAINKARRERPSDPLDISGVISKSNLRSFTLKELQVATYNFSDKFVVGRGGFGKVYKGLLTDGSFVAIKRLDQSSRQGSEQFQVEVDIGSTIRHRNVVAAIGFCVSKKPEEKLLVYPFKVNGDLSSRLRKHQSQPPLDWPTSKRILLGAARGLLYLHNNRIIHRDIKPLNILLDENLEARIGDFGIAMALDKRKERVPSLVSELQNHDVYYSTRIIGTFGYLDPEYAMEGKCSVKIDVYSFGVTIFEVITGQKPTDIMMNEGDGISGWVRSCLKENQMYKLLDPDLLGNCMEDDVKKAIQLGLACTLKFPEKRPGMLQVVQVLEGADLKDIGTDTD